MATYRHLRTHTLLWAPVCVLRVDLFIQLFDIHKQVSRHLSPELCPSRIRLVVGHNPISTGSVGAKSMTSRDTVLMKIGFPDHYVAELCNHGHAEVSLECY